ncbi:fungal-specific transcription factor domain-containing protein [Mycena capillaripes]|nr:fungal-specific transcription factor domain-containing protein [Mycena capillaripes]
MSSNDDDYGQEFRRGKKRRVQRACDVCRRRKSRCDGSQMPGDKCTTCIDANLDCTYLEATAKRPPPKSYVDSLESRLEHSEALVRQLRAELASTHFSNSSANTAPSFSPNSPPDTTTNADRTADASARAEGISGTDASMFIMRTALRSLAAPPPPPHADDLTHLEIARKLEKLSVNSMPEHRFMGKSSGAMLVKVAIDLKENVKREEREIALGHPSREPSLEDGSVGSESEDDDGTDPHLLWPSRRLQYWHWKPWENTAHRTHAYKFPSQARMSQFIDLYFTHQNMYIPLLHRPTFERNIAEGLHLRNDGFASTVLLVCAIASRWATDAAVTGVDLACGWEWFDQVPLVGNHLFGQATLYDLQYYCLAVQFLDGSSAPQACWTLIGVGLRLAQDIGCHRRSARIEVPSVERELYKRAFWVLVFLDRNLSSNLGRPCAVQYDDFDIDLPIECDDEYWEHPTHPFQQPADVPSRVTFFNTLIGLHHILAFSLKVLYGLNKIRFFFHMNEAWEENAVAELDSALNDWRDRVPEHLRWESTREDPVFFDQSVALHCSYYHLQILIHRPFIPMLRKSAPTGLPSLAICTSAARAIAGMVDVQRQRKGSVPVVINLSPVFIAGIILLLNVWSGKRTGLVPDPSREMANVHKCMEVMRLCEHRWQIGGLLWDIIAELASVGQLPLPNWNGSSPAGTDSHIHQPSAVNGTGAPESCPPLRRGVYPRCGVTPMSPEDTSRILQGARGLRQTFDRPVHDPQFRAPYAPMPQPSSFAGGVGVDAGTFGPSPMEPSAFAPTPAPETWFPAEDPYAQYTTDPTQASHELGDMMHLIDSDTISMWTNAPMGLEVDDWGNYFSNFSELTQGQQAAHAGIGMNGHQDPLIAP